MLSNATGRNSSSFVTRGAILNGLVDGRMARKNGHMSGWSFYPKSGMRSEAMANSSWSVRRFSLDSTESQLSLYRRLDSDWLECFERIDRTILFDSSWILSSEWLRVKAKPLPSAWSYGDVSCKPTFKTTQILTNF